MNTCCPLLVRLVTNDLARLGTACSCHLLYVVQSVHKCMHCSLQKGYTPLLMACEYEHVSVVKLLLKEADVDAKHTTKVLCVLSKSFY